VDSEPSFINRVEGCLLGLSLADAVGAAFEGTSAVSLRRRFDAPADAFDFAASGNLSYTDDGQMALALASYLSELRALEPVEPNALMQVFVREYQPWRGYGRGARTLIEAFRDGIEYEFLAQSLFPGGSLGNGAAMRSAPLGLRYRRDRATIGSQARLSALPTHRHPVGIEGAQLIAFAASIAAEDQALDPLTLAEQLRPHCHTEVFRKRIAMLGDVSRPTDVEALGNGIEAHESVPTALACFALYPDDYVDAVSLAIWQGGDTDTIAAMTGALVGARIGSTRLPVAPLSRLEEGLGFLARVRKLAANFVQAAGESDSPLHDLDASPVDWVIDQPSAAAIFDRLGIDYSCPGKSLEYQCQRLGLDGADVLRQLREAADGATSDDRGQ
jgi:poly(ADP-ribose) glycohydrolase ARH3